MNLRINVSPPLLAPSPHTLRPPSSKSESNRALLIAACSQAPIHLENLSEARDTYLMQQALDQLASGATELDIRDAGTAMRFLTAYLALRGEPVRLTGTARMQERPISPLVEALQTLGAQITYEGKEGFPPLSFGPFQDSGCAVLDMEASVSSQFISAILLASPLLGRPLEIRFRGKAASFPYLAMTAELMQRFGSPCQLSQEAVLLSGQPYQAGTYPVEGDWSAASYPLAWVGLLPIGTEWVLQGYRAQSLQGDIRILDLMRPLGVASRWQGTDLVLSQGPVQTSGQVLDFSDCPDLAQTVLVYAAAKGIARQATGLHTLYIKETNRVAALQTELQRIGADLVETSPGLFQVKPIPAPWQEPICFHTYEDHRMAMALAPLACLGPVEIEGAECVAKSWPGYWSALEQAGISVWES